MSATTTITAPPVGSVEERLSALEIEVAQLKQRLAKPEVDPDWLAKLTGSMEDVPEFLEVVEYGKQFRESHPYVDEDPDAW